MLAEQGQPDDNMYVIAKAGWLLNMFFVACDYGLRVNF